jgi:hypothetical protein
VPGFGHLAAGMPSGAFLAVIMLMLVWSSVWKLIALWQAARRDQIGWYLLLAILNTAGILEIIYIFAIAPRRPDLLASPGPDASPG